MKLKLNIEFGARKIILKFLHDLNNHLGVILFYKRNLLCETFGHIGGLAVSNYLTSFKLTSFTVRQNRN